MLPHSPLGLAMTHYMLNVHKVRLRTLTHPCQQFAMLMYHPLAALASTVADELQDLWYIDTKQAQQGEESSTSGVTQPMHCTTTPMILCRAILVSACAFWEPEQQHEGSTPKAVKCPLCISVRVSFKSSFKGASRDRKLYKCYIALG